MCRSYRLVGAALALSLIAGACGGGTQAGADEGEGIVINQDQLEAAEAQRDGETPEAEIASAPDPTSNDSDQTTTPVDTAEVDSDDDDQEDDGLEVAEADEDELDGLLNAVSIFTSCLDDEGYDFIGAPGQNGATPDDFETDYMAALGKCATQSDILGAFDSFGAAQASLSPEEIEQNNFGLPTFKECMEDLGWEVADLVPDERGALGFGTGPGVGLTPPEGADPLDFDDVNICRLEAERYVEENFVAEDS